METRFIVVLLAVATVTSEGSAQTRLIPTSRSVGWLPETTRDVQPALYPLQERELSPSRQIATSTLSAVGSFTGFWVGIFVMADHQYDVAGIFSGAAIGSVTGAALGAGVVSGNTGPSIAGSIGGLVVGGTLSMGAARLTHDPLLTMVVFSVAQGMTAAWVALS